MIKSMEDLAKEGAIFIGYNVKFGNAMGTLKNISDEQKLETPVAESDDWFGNWRILKVLFL